jgi:hypothetical protein
MIVHALRGSAFLNACDTFNATVRSVEPLMPPDGGSV